MNVRNMYHWIQKFRILLIYSFEGFHPSLINGQDYIIHCQRMDDSVLLFWYEIMIILYDVISLFLVYNYPCVYVKELLLKEYR